MIFEVTIPEKVSMNKVKGMDWRKWYSLATLFHMEFLEVQGKLKVEEYPVTISYDWHFAGKPLDTLNTALMCKLLEDGMVKAGILKDDSTTYVRRSVIESQKSKTYKLDTVVVKIEKFVP